MPPDGDYAKLVYYYIIVAYMYRDLFYILGPAFLYVFVVWPPYVIMAPGLAIHQYYLV